MIARICDRAEAALIGEGQHDTAVFKAVRQRKVQLLEVANAAGRDIGRRNMQRIAGNPVAVIGKDQLTAVRGIIITRSIDRSPGDIRPRGTVPRAERDDIAARVLRRIIGASAGNLSADRSSGNRDMILRCRPLRRCSGRSAVDIRDCTAIDEGAVAIRRTARHSSIDRADLSVVDMDLIALRRAACRCGIAAVGRCDLSLHDRSGGIDIRAVNKDVVIFRMRRAVGLSAVNGIDVRCRNPRHRERIPLSVAAIHVRNAAGDFVRVRRIRSVIRPCVVLELRIDQEHFLRLARRRVRLQYIFCIACAVVAPHRSRLKLQRARRVAADERNPAAGVSSLEVRQILNRQLIPVDLPAESAAPYRQHGRPIGNQRVQLECVVVKILNAFDRNILRPNVQRVAVLCIGGSVVAVDVRMDEIRGICTVGTAKRDCIRSRCAVRRITAVNTAVGYRIADCSARNGDGIVLYGAASCAVSAVDIIDRAACNRDDIAHAIRRTADSSGIRRVHDRAAVCRCDGVHGIRRDRLVSACDCQMIFRDIAARPLILSAECSGKISGEARHRQRIVRRRMTGTGKSAVKFTDCRCSSVVSHAAPVEAVVVQQQRICCIHTAVCAQFQLMRQRCGKLTHGCVELQLCRRLPLKKSNAPSPMLINRADFDILQRNAVSCRIERSCIDNLEHGITGADRIAEVKTIRVEPIDGFHRGPLGIDRKNIA